jgi:hypothetical protein
MAMYTTLRCMQTYTVLTYSTALHSVFVDGQCQQIKEKESFSQTTLEYYTLSIISIHIKTGLAVN